MSRQSHQARLDLPCRYRIAVQGQLDLRWVRSLSNIEQERSTVPGEAPVNVLTGEATDQAMLLGLLNMLYDHRLSLLSVETWYDDADETPISGA